MWIVSARPGWDELLARVVMVYQQGWCMHGLQHHLSIEPQPTAIFAFFLQVVKVLVVDTNLRRRISLCGVRVLLATHHVDCINPKRFCCDDDLGSSVQQLLPCVGSYDGCICTVYVK